MTICRSWFYAFNFWRFFVFAFSYFGVALHNFCYNFLICNLSLAFNVCIAQKVISKFTFRNWQIKDFFKFWNASTFHIDEPCHLQFCIVVGATKHQNLLVRFAASNAKSCFRKKTHLKYFIIPWPSCWIKLVVFEGKNLF